MTNGCALSRLHCGNPTSRSWISNAQAAEGWGVSCPTSGFRISGAGAEVFDDAARFEQYLQMAAPVPSNPCIASVREVKNAVLTGTSPERRRLRPLLFQIRVWATSGLRDGSEQNGQAVRSLILSEVGAVLLVLAEHFKNVVVGHQFVRDLDGKGLGVHLGIVKGHFDVQVSEVAAVEPLGDAQGFAMA